MAVLAEIGHSSGSRHSRINAQKGKFSPTVLQKLLGNLRHTYLSPLVLTTSIRSVFLIDVIFDQIPALPFDIDAYGKHSTRPCTVAFNFEELLS